MPISEKQQKILAFPYSKKYQSIICDGAVRSGKTSIMTVAFVDWAMREFNNTNFAICGKTVGSAIKNIIIPYMSLSYSKKYNISFTRSDNKMVVSSSNKTNIFFVYGGKDESSYMLIQGITLAGVLLDEVALMTRSFVEQALARCLSFKNRRYFFNCNPDHPKHWFYEEWIKQSEKHKALHLHFRMTDNPILDEETIKEAENTWSGVFYERFVLGRWVLAEGLIYSHFASNNKDYIIDDIPKAFTKILIGADWGDNKSAHSFTATGIAGRFESITALMTERHPAKDLTPADVEQKLVAFVKKVIERYGRADFIFCDHVNTFINGCRVALRNAGIRTSIGQANKCEINERIITTTRLMASGRLYLTKDCETLRVALNAAVWDDKHPDKRLDDGSFDNDSIDSFEYSWSHYIDMFSLRR